MRRALLIAFLAALGAASPAATAEAAVAKARTTGCVPALDAFEREASFTGDMRTVRGASQLQMKFVLQARTQERRRWTSVAAPGFGTWNTSALGIGRYVYTKTVENLLAPARYRALVRFRWLTATGTTLLRSRRVTPACRQPDLRPDLVPERLTRSGERYALTLHNDGRSPADGFTVTIEIAGRRYPLAYVEQLAAGRRTRLAGAAPACLAGENVTVRVDADGAVDEVDEEGNALTVPCPDSRGA